MLKERCATDKTSFPELMEADVFLMLASLAQAFAPARADEWPIIWGARTTIYSADGNRLRIFLRAADEETRGGILAAIGVASGIDLQTRLEAASTRFPGFARNHSYRSHFNFFEAINAAELMK